MGFLIVPSQPCAEFVNHGLPHGGGGGACLLRVDCTMKEARKGCASHIQFLLLNSPVVHCFLSKWKGNEVDRKKQKSTPVPFPWRNEFISLLRNSWGIEDSQYLFLPISIPKQLSSIKELLKIPWYQVENLPDIIRKTEKKVTFSTMRFNVYFNLLSGNCLKLSHMPLKLISSNLSLGNTDLLKLPHFIEEIN